MTNDEVRRTDEELVGPKPDFSAMTDKQVRAHAGIGAAAMAQGLARTAAARAELKRRGMSNAAIDKMVAAGPGGPVT